MNNEFNFYEKISKKNIGDNIVLEGFILFINLFLLLFKMILCFLVMFFFIML